MTINGPKKVLEVGRWIVPWACPSSGKQSKDTMFKVPAGKLGATEDLFLSYWHQVKCDDGVMRPVAVSHVLLAVKEEVCDDESDSHTLFHVCVEDWKNNHLLVNGGCVVESWPGSIETKN